MDEKLEMFLNHWESVRTGLLKKYQLQVEYFRPKEDMRVCLESAQHKVEHYRHEIEMLRELRARSLP